jgi:hypothetical protein
MHPIRAQPSQLDLPLPSPTEIHQDTWAEVLKALGDLLRQGALRRNQLQPGNEAGVATTDQGAGHE